ncbi:hypothetical protein D3C72_1165350 [compost metagenome]
MFLHAGQYDGQATHGQGVDVRTAHGRRALRDAAAQARGGAVDLAFVTCAHRQLAGKTESTVGSDGHFIRAVCQHDAGARQQAADRAAQQIARRLDRRHGCRWRRGRAAGTAATGTQ